MNLKILEIGITEHQSLRLLNDWKEWEKDRRNRCINILKPHLREKISSYEKVTILWEFQTFKIKVYSAEKLQSLWGTDWYQLILLETLRFVILNTWNPSEGGSQPETWIVFPPRVNTKNHHSVGSKTDSQIWIRRLWKPERTHSYLEYYFYHSRSIVSKLYCEDSGGPTSVSHSVSIHETQLWVKIVFF